jgi:ribosomal protein S18 acetylase RimI-like enzyme
VSDASEQFLVFPACSWPLTARQIQRLAALRLDPSVLTHQQRVVGFANLYDLAPGQWAFVGSLIIGHDYRGQRLGRQLLDYMLKRIYSNYALPVARLSVFRDNRRAHALYSRLGFRQYGEEIKTDAWGRPFTLLHLECTRDSYCPE